jgi:hypothetical protein
MDDRVGQATELGGGPAASDVPGAPGRFLIPSSRVRSASAVAASSLDRLSRMTQRGDRPGSRRRARSPSVRASVVTARSTCAMDRYAHRQRLLDIGLGVAHQLAEQRQRVTRHARSRPRRWSTCGIVAIVDPTSRRSQRDGL